MRYIILIFHLLFNIEDINGFTRLIESDTLIIESKTLIIKGQTFIFEYHHTDHYDKLYFTNNNKKRILLNKGVIHETKFLDVNNDKFEDVLFCTFFKNALYCYLFVYDQASRDFVEVKDFFHLPEPQKIPNTKYFQSTHTSIEYGGHIDQKKLLMIVENKIKLLCTITDYVYDDAKKNKTILKYCGKKIRINLDVYSEGNEGPYNEQTEIEFNERFWKKILKKYKLC